MIAAGVQGSGPSQYTMTGYYDRDIATLPETGVTAGQPWRQSGLRPADICTAILYGHFTIIPCRPGWS